MIKTNEIGVFDSNESARTLKFALEIETEINAFLQPLDEHPLNPMKI